MNDRQLECFIQAATYLNFRRAAENLFISQPAMTYQIKSLETELGFPLFDRSLKNVRLTDAGKVFYDEMLPLWGAIKAAVEKARGAIVESNAVHFRWTPTLLSQDAMSTFVSRFRSLHPDIALTVDVAEGNYLAAAETDVAVITLQEDAERLPNVEFTPLLPLYRSCLVSLSHPLAGSATISWDDLRTQTLLLLSREHYPSSYAPVVEEATHFLPSRNITYLEDIPSVDANIAAGRGIGIRPIPQAELRKPNRGIMAVPLEPLQVLHLGIATLSECNNPNLATLVNAAREFFTAEA